MTARRRTPGTQAVPRKPGNETTTEGEAKRKGEGNSGKGSTGNTAGRHRRKPFVL